MTDTTVTPESATPDETPEPESVQTVTVPEFSNAILRDFWQQTLDAINQRNQKANSLRADDTSAAEVNQKLNDSDQAEIVEFRTKIEQADAALKQLRVDAKAWVRANVFGETGLSDDDRKKASDEISALEAEIKSYTASGELMAKKEGKAFAQGLPELVSLKGTGLSPAGTRTGQSKGVSRMRVAYVSVNGKHYKTYTEAKPAIETALDGKKIEIGDVHKAYFAAAGVPSFKDAPDVVNFTYQGVEMEVGKVNE